MPLPDEEPTIIDGPKGASSGSRASITPGDAFDSDEKLAPGTAAGHWIIDGVLSRGGGGEVYLAHHAQLMRKVAVKVLLKALANHPITVQRFVQEAVAVNQIRHPSIVDVFEFGSLADGRPYLVMELLEGETIQQLIRRQGRLSPEEVLEILAPLCDALDAAHRAGFVHRDVKAANVHLGTDRDGGRRVTLLDFGIAKALRPDAPGAGMTTRGTRLGSITSMAPEQVLAGRITPRTDVYALGALLWRMLAGRHVFDADTVQQLERMHVEAIVPNISDYAPVPRTWNSVVKTAMAKEPSERFTGALDFMMAARAAHRLKGAISAEPTLLALGIHIRIAPATSHTDAALTATLDAIDRTEDALQTSAFTYFRVVGASLLGAQILEERSTEERRAICADACRFGSALFDDLTAHSAAPLHIRVVVHVDRVALTTIDNAVELGGGPLLDSDRWASTSEPQGFHCTPAVAALLA